MGWFDDFLDIGNGSSWIAPVISGVATIAGSVITSSANSSAADKAAAAAKANADAITQGNTLAQQRFDQVRADTAPAVQYAKNVINSSTGLTPYQEEQIKDARRQTVNALSVSGLRGSGRATTAAVKKVSGDMTGQFLDSNSKRADSAAATLSGQYFNAVNNQANLDTSSGRAAGTAALTSGMVGAESDLANASQRGAALGDIATVINDAAKEGRKSNYAKPTPVGENTNQQQTF